jgi:inorganic pyrophosphatase
MADNFWDALDRLVAENKLVIDRPKGSHHPRYPVTEIVYPLDYGYLEGTTAADGSGIDVWLGASGTRDLSAVMLTVDLTKRDTEIKLMLGCDDKEIKAALEFLNSGNMRATIVYRPKESL